VRINPVTERLSAPKIPVITKDDDFKLYKPHGLRIVW
jgi:hypothetical protein